MSEKTREVKKFQDTMYTQSLCGETIYKYKLLGPFGFNLPHPMGALGRGPMAPMVHGKFEPYGPWTLYS